jgi:hypothetical protein
VFYPALKDFLIQIKVNLVFNALNYVKPAMKIFALLVLRGLSYKIIKNVYLNVMKINIYH